MRAAGAAAGAPVRLICFPHAGVGPSAYRQWAPEMAPHVDVVSVLLPGREARLGEPPLRDIEPIIDSVTAALRPLLDRPFAFFGHSMGAVVAFEVSRRLRDTGAGEPLHLFVSGHRAPQLPPRHPPLAHLGDADFIRELQLRYDGIPREVLRHPDLLALLLPAMKADLAAVEGYTFRASLPLACPLSALGGIDDEEATHDELDAWREQSTGPFSLHRLPGGHFYLQALRSAVIDIVMQRLRPAALAERAR